MADEVFLREITIIEAATPAAAQADTVLWNAAGAQIELHGVFASTGTAGTVEFEEGGGADVVPAIHLRDNDHEIVEFDAPYLLPLDVSLTYTTNIAAAHSVMAWGRLIGSTTSTSTSTTTTSTSTTSTSSSTSTTTTTSTSTSTTSTSSSTSTTTTTSTSTSTTSTSSSTTSTSTSTTSTSSSTTSTSSSTTTTTSTSTSTTSTSSSTSTTTTTSTSTSTTSTSSSTSTTTSTTTSTSTSTTSTSSSTTTTTSTSTSTTSTSSSTSTSTSTTSTSSSTSTSTSTSTTSTSSSTSTTLARYVADSDDDATANVTDSEISVITTYLAFGADDPEGSRDSWSSGIRFNSVMIPQGSTILSAYLRGVASDTLTSTTVNINIKGQDANNANDFSTYADFAARARTTALVAWDGIASWTAGTVYTSPDIKTVIQEIVDRALWQAGNGMVFFIENDASTVGAYREFAAYDHLVYNPVQLVVMWH